MELNWIIIVLVSVCAIALIVYLVKQNQKDQKEITRFFNADTETKTKTENKPELEEDKD